MKQKFYVLMAVLSGLVFGLSIFYYLNTVQRASDTELKPLVVASMDIPARTIVQASQLQIIDVPTTGFPQGGANTVEDVVGKILLVGVKKGDVLITPMLESSYQAGTEYFSPQNSFSLTVPQGKRAVAIPVSLVGSVGFKVKPGDRVDVLITMDIKEAGGSKTITSLAAQDVLVLNTGDTQLKENEKVSNSGSYILAMSVTQAMAVTLGSEKGSVRLLLRNPANKEVLTETPIDPLVYYSPAYFSHYR